MKIGFLSAKRAEGQYKEEFEKIVSYFESLGHQVVHHMDVSLEKVLPLSYADRQDLFMKFYEQLAECDLVFVETSIQSTQVGFGLAYLRLKGRPTVILSQGDITNQFFPKGDVYSNWDNMMAYQYNKANIKEVVDDALSYMQPHIEKRFTIIFPAHLLAKVEGKAQKLAMPKSVYIRQLIEKDLTTSEK